MSQLYLMEEISGGHFEQAQERLNILRAQSKKPKMIDTYNQLERIINENKSRAQA